MVDSCETESTVGDGEGDWTYLVLFNKHVVIHGNETLGEEEPGGGDSSKSNSITSEQSIQSTGISASSQSSSTSSIPPRTVDPDNSSIYPLSVRNRTKVNLTYASKWNLQIFVELLNSVLPIYVL